MMDRLEQKSIGFLFPGQGAQAVGMGKDVYEKVPVAREVFDLANRILGYDLAKICFEGPEEELTRTLVAQPALFVTSLAVLAATKQAMPGMKPAACLGLSLGEYTALVAAGALSFEQGLKLVRARAEAMEAAAAEQKGTMASVLGMDEAACRQACDGIEGVWIANLNCPGQIVISGAVPGIEKACASLKEKGAKRVIPLSVSGAFHSGLMTSASERLRDAVMQAEIREPQCLFIPNVTAVPERVPQEIKRLLLSQLTGSVRWSESFGRCISEGITHFLEIGSGTVLKGLARKIDSSASVESLETHEQILNYQLQQAADSSQPS